MSTTTIIKETTDKRMRAMMTQEPANREPAAFWLEPEVLRCVYNREDIVE